MELTGDLSDFALTDILQILGLSRKTGTLLLETEDLAGKIVIEQGRITHASVNPGESLAERLVREKRIDSEVLSVLRRIGTEGKGIWTLKSLLVESGAITGDEMELVYRLQIQDVVSMLVGLDKGRFGIELNQVKLNGKDDELWLKDGLEVGEVLLGAAKATDEDRRDSGSLVQSDGADGFGGLADGGPESDNLSPKLIHLNRPTNKHQRSADEHANVRQKESRVEPPALDVPRVRVSTLCSLLAELRTQSFEAEVSLLIMRYASEVATRGVLFVVKDGEARGLGQFGLESRGERRSPDARVREIRIPIGGGSILDAVVELRQPFIGALPDSYWNTELLSRIGGMPGPLSVFALPLIYQGQTTFVFYGDNYPGIDELKGLDELVALVEQASVMLEKIALERMLAEIRNPRDRRFR